MWPGRERSSGFVSGSTIARIVVARSAAEMPVRDVAPRVDRDGERRSAQVRVRGDHQRDLELVEAVAEHRHTDHPARVPHDEGDGLRCDLFRRHDEVAFVLSIGVVDDDARCDPAGCPQRRPGSSRTPSPRRSRAFAAPARSSGPSFRSRQDPGSATVSTCSARLRSTYFAMMSTSRFTGRPGARGPRVVTASVCGMRATVMPSSCAPGHGEAHAVDADRALLHDVAHQLGSARAGAAGAARTVGAPRRRPHRHRRRGPAPGGRRAAMRAHGALEVHGRARRRDVAGWCGRWSPRRRRTPGRPRRARPP